MTPRSKNAHGMWWELQRSHGAHVRGRPNAGAEGTAKAAGNDDTATSSQVADDGNLGDGSGVGNTLWEQMTAREGKDAARLAGMRAGDWQAERQLQEALRESRQDGGPVGVASSLEGSGREDDEASFVDTGFHALATNAVEGEEGEGEAAAAADNEAASSLGQQPIGGSSAAAAGATAGDGSTTAQEEEDREVEEEEDYGDVELVVTQDGGIIPVATGAVGDGSAATDRAQETPAEEEEEEHDHKLAKKAYEGGVRVGVAKEDVGAAAADNEHLPKIATAMDEEQGEEVTPLPPDIVLTMPDDILHRTMLFLNPEDIFECRAVSSRWSFPGHENVYEGLCRRTYLAQSAKKMLNVKRWRSWQRMFKFRPRLRDTGLYSLKTTYFKKPVRDMSTEWTPGKILRVTYYRYFKFFGDGRVAYALTHEPPKDFVRMLQDALAFPPPGQ
ncbi:conserved unknown protein [Ectocarpus siliculosus]|uniref:F-box domain-containing protein n=1 Tax=Ectocarpus siliculosus TaxID=2880 RepID=D8LI39_ECTSI|nr:conserved unknown protein [Ectocarpus siliculosus]|eukprot:CBN79375.1 conserved unknown protein [Ectocarpus siliculosus]